MKKKIIRRTPDQLGYQDRGKMKWQGLILSDMNEMLKEYQALEQSKGPSAKKKMTRSEVAEILQEAYLTKGLVTIQANIMKDGQYYPDVYCLVLGYYENEIYFQLKDGQIRSCHIDQIRNVAY